MNTLDSTRPRAARMIASAIAALALVAFTAATSFAATTYTWSGGATGPWTTAANWTPTRTVTAVDDIIVINTTAIITALPAAQTIGELHVTSGATATLQATAAAALQINGGAAANDFEVTGGSTLNLTGTNVAITLGLGASATGAVGGTINVAGSSVATAHRITSAAASALVFQSGSALNIGLLLSGNIFGTTSLNSVVFQSGSTYSQGSGSNPFGASAPNSVVVFQTGSNFILTAALTPSVSGRVYSNFEYNNAGTVSVTGGGGTNFDNFTISAGIFNYNVTTTGATTNAIKGNVLVKAGATLGITPASASSLTFSGSSAQTVTNLGTLTVTGGAFLATTVTNTAGVTLASPISYSGLSLTVGAGATLATSATLTSSAPVSVLGTFQLNEGGFATGAGVWTYGASSTLAFNNTSGPYGVNPTDVYWPSVSGPPNVNVKNSGGLNMNTARTVSGTFQTVSGVNGTSLTTNGPCQLNAGGFFNTSPTYGPASTLVYNTGGSYGIFNEWVGGVVQPGVPANVTIQNSTAVDFNPNRSTTAMTATGNVTIGPGSSLTLGNAIGGDLYVGGNLSNSGTFTHNNRLVKFNGSSAQTLTGVPSLAYAELANSAGLLLTADLTIGNQLTFTAGKITTGANKVILASGAATSGAGAGKYIFGTEQKAMTVSAGVSNGTLDVGDASIYAPVDFFTNTGAGNFNLTGSTTAGDHPNIGSSSFDAGKTVNRYWSVSTSPAFAFGNADLTFHWDPTDVDGPATPANFAVAKYDPSTWTPLSSTSPLATSIKATGVTSFSDFQVGELASYTITSSAGGGGTIAPLGATTVPSGGSQAYTITPSACFTIADVLVDGNSVGAVGSYTFTGVSANHTIAASFAAAGPYTITATAGGGGSIAPPGATVVACGGSQPYTISADDACHVIADVLVDGSSVGAVASYTFVNVTANHTISASFSLLGPYTITATAGGGGSIAPPGATVVACGGSQPYTIAADPCFTIADVLVDGSSVGAVASYTFLNVSANHTISASFSAVGPYTITTTAGAGGLIAPSGAVSVACGASQSFGFMPAACFVVADVLVDGISQGPVGSYTFINVQANHTIAVSFTASAPYTINATAGAGGSISPSGSVAVACGANQPFSITPSGGYNIQDVLVDGSSVGAVGAYTFLNVTTNHTIAASFVLAFAPVTDITSGFSFATIQGAINDATTNPGDIIVASAGTYVENVTVSKAVTLRGAQTGVGACGRVAAETIVQPANPALPTLTIPGGTGIVVDGFTFDQLGGNPGGTSAAVFQSAATPNLKFLNNRIINFKTQALWFQRAATDAVIDGNSMDGSGEVGASQTLFMSTNSYAGLHLTNNCINNGTGAGWFVDGNRTVGTGASNPVISGNTFNNNAGVGVNAGSRSLDNASISNNVFSNSGFDGFQGGPSNSTFTGNNFHHNKRWGLALTSFGNTSAGRGAFNVTLKLNTFANNDSAGYFVSATQPAGNVNSTHANENDIVNNGSGAGGLRYGAIYRGTETFDVGCNWWGDIGGPNYPPTNPNPLGDKLFATTATFSPWLNASITGPHACDQTIKHTIVASAGPGGSITPSGNVLVNDGANQSFAIAADGCHTIADVLVDGVSVGAVSSYTFLTVVTDHTIAASFSLIPPTITAVTGLSSSQQKTGNDADGTTKIKLTFTAPGGAATVEVWRKGYGSYPTYDNGGGSVPTLPGSYPPAGWAPTLVTASGQSDEPPTRDFWYYVAYAKDACGNVGPVSNLSAGTLDYHLGDVSDGITAGQGDNTVGTPDVSLLGAHYGLSGGALAGFEYLDVGPTTDNSTNGRPTTDSKTNFDDLVMFALNYAPAVSLVKKGGTSTQSVNTLALEAPAEVAVGDVFEVPVQLTGAGDLQALSLTLGWNAAVVEPIDMTPGELVTSQGGVVFSPGPGRADAAMLGAGHTMSGQGTVATVRFRALAAGEPRVSIAVADGRSSSNQAVKVTVQNPLAVEARVTATDLQPVIPNPSPGRAMLNYSLAARGAVDLSIYSVDGRRVKTLAHGVQEVGRYHVTWDGSDERGSVAKAGVYFVRIEAPALHKTRVINLVR